MKRIQVKVAEWGEGHKFMLRWRDPETGERRAETSGTFDWDEASKKAGILEEQLNEGTYVPRKQRVKRARPSSMTWKDFVARHVREVQSGQAVKTRNAYRTAFNSVVRILSVKRLAELNTERLSDWQATLREEAKSEYTIKSYRAHLRSALGWAVDLGMMKALPKFSKVVRARGGKTMKGRPLCGEEFEKLMLSVKAALTQQPHKRRKTAKVPSPRVVASWQYLLEGLWWGGFRLGEALNLSWDRRDRPCIDLTGKRPMLWIPGECQKSGKDELYPLAPEFCQLILLTPPEQRRGRVFRPLGMRGDVGPLGLVHVSDMITRIGKAAAVKVDVKTKQGPDGKPRTVVKWASAHDLRRSFGNRWKDRVMPIDLQAMMRHEDLQTTLKYYTARDARKTADSMWAAYEDATRRIGQGCGQSVNDGTTDFVSPKAKPLAEQGVKKLGN